MLREMLAELRSGQVLELGEYVPNLSNGYREKDITWLTFENGRWYEEHRNCFSDTCNCVSHPTYMKSVISRKEALRLIHNEIVRLQSDRAIRDAEIAWLDKAIEELPER